MTDWLRLGWQQRQWHQIRRIYIMVLKHGWKIRHTKTTQHGVHCFMMSGADDVHGSWSGWQVYPLGQHMQELVILPEPPKDEEWTIQ